MGWGFLHVMGPGSCVHMVVSFASVLPRSGGFLAWLGDPTPPTSITSGLQPALPLPGQLVAPCMCCSEVAFRNESEAVVAGWGSHAEGLLCQEIQGLSHRVMPHAVCCCAAWYALYVVDPPFLGSARTATHHGQFLPDVQGVVLPILCGVLYGIELVWGH